MINLGKLKEIKDLRKVWPHEALDFTPWLAEEDSILGGTSNMIKILFVCHGNICRSPMAEFVMKDLVQKAGCADEWEIASAAVSREEIGNPVHPGTRERLRREGISTAGKWAVQMTREDYERYDWLIGMDTSNLRWMQRITGGDPHHKMSRLLEWTGENRDVADPWYTGDFEQTYRDIDRGCRALLEKAEGMEK